MTYEIDLYPPQYVLEPHGYVGNLIVASRTDLPQGHQDLAVIAFHRGRLKWYFTHERNSPFTQFPCLLEFMTLDEACARFEQQTGLQVPEFMVLQRNEVQPYIYCGDGQFEKTEEPDPSIIHPGREYKLLEQLSFAHAGYIHYIGIASSDGRGRLARKIDAPESEQRAFWELKTSKQHDVVRANLGLPLVPDPAERDGPAVTPPPQQQEPTMRPRVSG